MKPTGEGRGLSEVRGRTGLQVRGVAGPEMWMGLGGRQIEAGRPEGLAVLDER